jgi:hypothetical protein
MLSFMMGSSRRMLALEKKALMVLRRMRCVSWSMVATMEFWAVLREKGLVVVCFHCWLRKIRILTSSSPPRKHVFVRFPCRAGIQRVDELGVVEVDLVGVDTNNGA